MQRVILIFLLLFLSFSNSLALTASDIDASPALFDLSLVVTMVLTILMLLLGYRKVFNLIGK